MKKTIKILCMVMSLLFVFVGVSFGYQYYNDQEDLTTQLLRAGGLDFSFTQPVGSADPGKPWANLNVQLSGSAGDYTYAFVLSNVDPNEFLEVSSLRIPVIAHHYGTPYTNVGDGTLPYQTAYYAAGEYNGVQLKANLMIDFFSDASPFGIVPGTESLPILIDSDLEPGFGIAWIIDGGVPATTTSVSALIGVTGGAGGGLPEPTTVLLLGIGLLGTGAFRYLSSKRRG